MARSGRAPRLVQAVREFVDSDSWAAARVVVEREPRLLSDAADDVLIDLIAQARQHDDEKAVRGFAEHRDCLRLIRADGLERLDEMIGAGVPEPLRERWVEAELAYERYRRDQTRKRMDSALRLVDQVLTDPMVPAVGADRRAGLAQAAAGVAVARYLVGDDGADLDRAVELYRLTLAQLPNADPDRSAAASALGSALCIRYELHGARSDLDEGIDWTRRAAPGAPLGERWLVQHNLAANLGMRYELLGEPDDLVDAVDAVRDALAADPPAAAAPQLVHTSAGLLITRFERDGGLDDLEAAAEIVERVMPVATTTDERAPLRVTLATVAELRYQLDGDVSRLDQAVAELRLAVREFGRGSAHRPLCLQHLGTAAHAVGGNRRSGCAPRRPGIAAPGRCQCARDGPTGSAVRHPARTCRTPGRGR
jgi:tetratricopeptide (TPR) repeat protein